MGLELLGRDIALVFLKVVDCFLDEVFLLGCSRSFELLNHVGSIKSLFNGLDTIF